MRNERGFSLIELLIVVAIILIIAAIAIPSLIRARISANEANVVGDIRSFVSAEATFESVAHGYGDATCLYPDPSACHAGAGTVPMIDFVLADTAQDKAGYDRAFSNDGNAVTGPNVVTGVWIGFCYGGTPATLGRSGNRSFSGDSTGAIVYGVGGVPCCVGGANDVGACQVLIGN